jgi:hypothetical protein
MISAVGTTSLFGSDTLQPAERLAAGQRGASGKPDATAANGKAPPGKAGGKADVKPTDPTVLKLRARDTEVRAHEAAHIAAGGSFVRGAASFTYETGPDGKAYAVGGEVSIDTSPVPGDPQATIAKMAVIRAAALAPSDPSGQDISVAASASEQEAKARAELAQQKSAGAVAGKYEPAVDVVGSLVNASA